jgi:DNA-binding LacI/PurR family transcriptional regulator
VIDFLHGVTRALVPTVYQTWLNLFDDASEFYRQMTLQQIRQRVDGLMVGGSFSPRLFPLLDSIAKAGIPLVTFVSAARPGITNICVDYYQQGRLPTEHLLAGNCRKIATIKALSSRYQGYADALREAGLPVKSEYIIRCAGFGVEIGRAAVRKLLKAKIPFDGIVAQSDLQALGAIRELLANGIRVPDQVRVTGVDDGPIAVTSPIPLTTVTSEARHMGLLVVETMLKKISKEPVKSVLITPKVVIRSSG